MATDWVCCSTLLWLVRADPQGGGGGGPGRGGGQPRTTVVLLLGCRLFAGEADGPRGEEDANGDHPESEDSGQEGSFVSWAIFLRASVPAGGREDRRRGGRLGPCRWRICEGLGLQRRNPPPCAGVAREAEIGQARSCRPEVGPASAAVSGPEPKTATDRGDRPRGLGRCGQGCRVLGRVWISTCPVCARPVLNMSEVVRWQTIGQARQELWHRKPCPTEPDRAAPAPPRGPTRAFSLLRRLRAKAAASPSGGRSESSEGGPGLRDHGLQELGPARPKSVAGTIATEFIKLQTLLIPFRRSLSNNKVGAPEYREVYECTNLVPME